MPAPLDRKDPAELTTAQGKKLIGDLADFKVPVILFSGGEPLLREDIFELAALASRKGLRVALSTNGTLIDAEKAGRIKDIGFAEVGISLDGIGAANDRFRRARGAYRAALQGIRNCLALGIRVSLRLTITRFNHDQVRGHLRPGRGRGHRPPVLLSPGLFRPRRKPAGRRPDARPGQVYSG